MIDMKGLRKMPDTITNSIGMEFVLIPSGSFRMGGDKKREQAEDHETPRHYVNFSSWLMRIVAFFDKYLNIF